MQLAVYEELKAFAVQLKIESMGPASVRAKKHPSAAVNDASANFSKLGFWEIGAVSLMSKAIASTITYPLQVRTPPSAYTLLQTEFHPRILEFPRLCLTFRLYAGGKVASSAAV